MAEGFLAGKENGLLELAADERGVGLGGFENRPQAGFLREQNLGHVEKRIDPRDLMDFFSDEMHGLRVRGDAYAHAIGGRGFLLLLGRAAAAVVVVAAASLGGTARTAIAVAITRSTAAATATAAGAVVTVVTSRRAILSSGETFRFALWLVAGIAGPCGAEREAG